MTIKALKQIKSIGPGIVVASAFIGPGTITVCSIAGSSYGYTLIWTLVFSIVTTIILQEMSLRLGVVTRQTLSAVITSIFSSRAGRWLVSVLVFSAIIIGNGAYEAGNISGAALGTSAIIEAPLLSKLLIFGCALLLIIAGSYKLIERAMIVLVSIMSIVFVISAVYVFPDFHVIVEGLIPSFPDNSIIVIIALIGTTVVPYNLFLHASSASTKWSQTSDLPKARFDNVISITIGGIISIAIVITSAASNTGEINNILSLSSQLKPLLGDAADEFLGMGLFAAGISSAVTAPLAAGYAASGLFRFSPKPENLKFKFVALTILIIGFIFSLLGFSPVNIIKFAQIANGFLLPFIAALLLFIVNKKRFMGKFTNGRIQNLLGLIVIFITLLLGVKGILNALEIL